MRKREERSAEKDLNGEYAIDDLITQISFYMSCNCTRAATIFTSETALVATSDGLLTRRHAIQIDQGKSGHPDEICLPSTIRSKGYTMYCILADDFNIELTALKPILVYQVRLSVCSLPSLPHL